MKITKKENKLVGILFAVILILGFSGPLIVTACDCRQIKNDVPSFDTEEKYIDNVKIPSGCMESRSIDCGWNNSYINNPTSQFDRVNAIVEFEGKIIFGGHFDLIGGITAHNIVLYDPILDQWSAMGNGLPDDVNSLIVINGALYAGGAFEWEFHEPYLLAKWNNGNWVAIGRTDLSNEVRSMVEYHGDLYIGGEFGLVKQGEQWTQMHNIARYSGGSWHKVGEGIQLLSPQPQKTGVYDMIVYEGDLYVGGGFKCAQEPGQYEPIEVPLTYGIARWHWDGFTGAWSSVDGGLLEPEDPMSMDYGCINALEVYDDGSGSVLYAGGLIKYLVSLGDTTDVNNIIKWDAINGWQIITSGDSGQYIGLPDVVTTLATYDDGNGIKLYAGGIFRTAGGNSVNNIASWNGNDWKALGGGLHSTGSDNFALIINDLKAYDNNLYVGGHFHYVGDLIGATPIYTYNIAKWSKPCNDCPTDITNDGTIDILDLLELLAYWGNMGGPGDVNDDGIVNINDLLMVLAMWGSCPSNGDACETARSIEPGDTIIADTSCSQLQNINLCWGGTAMGVHALWFKVIGDGTTFTAGLCNQGTGEWDHMMAIYSGDYDNLECEAYDDSSCLIPPSLSYLAPEITWFAESGTTYWIIVYGFCQEIDDYGQFNLTLVSN